MLLLNKIPTALVNLTNYLVLLKEEYQMESHPKILKTLAIYHILSLNYTVLYVDTDVYIYGDLVNALSKLPPKQAYYAIDNRNKNPLCNGVQYLQPTNEVKDIIWSSFKHFRFDQMSVDQPALIKELSNRSEVHGLIPFSIVDNAYDILGNTRGIIYNSTFVALHNNNVYTEACKYYRLKVLGLYKHNYQGEYNDVSRKYLYIEEPIGMEIVFMLSIRIKAT